MICLSFFVFSFFLFIRLLVCAFSFSGDEREGEGQSAPNDKGKNAGAEAVGGRTLISSLLQRLAFFLRSGLLNIWR